jgi:hypothetical protein
VFIELTRLIFFCRTACSRVEKPQDSALVVTVWDEDIWDADGTTLACHLLFGVGGAYSYRCQCFVVMARLYW